MTRVLRFGKILPVLSLLAVLVAATPAQATALYWDLNQDTANVAGPITGTWDGTALLWNTDSSGTGGTPQAGTTNADDLVFSSGNVYTTGTVTINHAPAASSITFEDNIAVTLAGAIPQNGSFVTADNTTETITYSGTAVQNGQVVTFGGTPPAGLTAGQVYYAINATATTYQVASSLGGSAIDFTDDGTLVTNTVKAALILGGTGAKSGIFVLAGNNANNTVSASIVLAANSTFKTEGEGALTISGSTVGSGNLALVNNR